MAFLRYGGRGITVCDRWMKFENFISDVGPRPSPRHTIDRIDSNGNYEPSNCKWSTWKEQENNRSDTVWLEFNGDKKTMKQWAEHLGLSYMALWHRRNQGWTVERMLSQPVQARSKRAA